MATLELEFSAIESYNLSQLREFCEERGLALRSGARKAECQKALRAYEEARKAQDDEEKE